VYLELESVEWTVDCSGPEWTGVDRRSERTVDFTVDMSVLWKVDRSGPVD